MFTCQWLERVKGFQLFFQKAFVWKYPCVLIHCGLCGLSHWGRSNRPRITPGTEKSLNAPLELSQLAKLALSRKLPRKLTPVVCQSGQGDVLYQRIGSVHAVIWQAGRNQEGPVRIQIYYGDRVISEELFLFAYIIIKRLFAKTQGSDFICPEQN